jgi:hypothetical protein
VATVVREANGHGAHTAFVDDQVTGAGSWVIDLKQPYSVRITVQGVAPLLWHRYDSDSVDAKAKADKGSKAKKTDDIQSYVYRTEDGHLGAPGKWIKAALCEAAKSHQDPRSPRKSMRDLMKAAIIPLTEVAPLEPLTKDWDYIDRQPVKVQMSRVLRERPAMRPGWRVSFDLRITTPQYVPIEKLITLLNEAGMLQGIGDYRPDYGRFSLVGLERLIDE